jgi:hypothetical protein
MHNLGDALRIRPHPETPAHPDHQLTGSRNRVISEAHTAPIGCRTSVSERIADSSLSIGCDRRTNRSCSDPSQFWDAHGLRRRPT